MNLEGKSFSLELVSHDSVLELLQQMNPSKSTGIDNLKGKFLKRVPQFYPHLSLIWSTYQFHCPRFLTIAK